MKIAFVGKMRAGKDTCAEYLCNKYDSQIYKFADRLYEMQEKLYEMAELPYSPDTKNRKLLQYLGTDFVRTIDPDAWVKILEKKLRKIIIQDVIYKEHALFNDYTPHNMFVTDARFPNEVTMLRSLGFTMVLVDRPLEERIKFGASDLQHLSETALDGKFTPDLTIVNDKTLDDLYQRVEEVAIIAKVMPNLL